MTAVPNNFGDLLDKRFTRIYDDRFKEESDRIAEFYQVMTGSQVSERFSTLGTIPDLVAFSGSINYADVSQGYDVVITPVQFARGFQIERTLVEDDQFNLMDQKPKALGAAASRSRQTHAARSFNNAFSVDSYFGNNSEGVALCSNSHTTTSGASTTTGFDNLVTSGLSAVSIAAMRVQMVNFRGDQAERITVKPNTLLVPEQGSMHETAWEIVNSQGKVDTANNNANFLRDKFQVKTWMYLTDANDYWLIDSAMMKDIGLIWIERTKPEFAFVEDFDTLVAKYRVYGRWANHWRDWRWIVGAQVG